MKWLFSVALAGLAMIFAGCQTTSDTGDTSFIAYEGKQSGWPTSPNAMVQTDYALPVYHGLPARRYEVVGRVVGTQRNVIGRSFAEGFWSDEDRMRNVCAQARQRGADAIILSTDPLLTEALRLPSGELRERESPLYDYDGAVIAIRWTDR